MINRQQAIKEKGFSMAVSNEKPYTPIDYSKIKVGIKSLQDAVLKIGNYKKINPRLGNKEYVLKAIHDGDIAAMQEISEFFYKTSGIYSRLCRYMANLYRADWVLTPHLDKSSKITAESPVAKKMTNEFYSALDFLDDFQIKRFYGDIALKVVKLGSYYGYKIPVGNTVQIQELPQKYCRSRFTVNGKPAVEFNMRYFDDIFTNEEYRKRILNLYPKDFRKGYNAFKAGRLTGDYPGDQAGWYLLDIENTIRFNLNDEEYPPFIAVIPAIIDLDEAEDLNKRKMQQQLLKIIIQKMPFDKNGDLIFDVDEARQLHNNAVQMLGKAIGIDVLTTFADVEVADMADNNNSTAANSLDRVVQAVYNEAGVSQMQFNTDGNIALEKSILNDEAAMWNLVLKFESFLNSLIIPFNRKGKRKYKFRVEVLPTTIYNYKDLAKLYKEQTQLGYSKTLPQIALGQSQSSVLATATFENEILNLSELFVPPRMSSTMSSKDMQGGNRSNQDKKTQDLDINKKSETGGRPTKEEKGEAVTEKTMQNKESQS